MEADHRIVTIRWRHPVAGETNRLDFSRRALLVLAGGVALAAVAAVVLGAVAFHLQGQNASLNARMRVLENEREALRRRLDQTAAEITAAREGLDRVREEESKIRSWLGLQEDEQPSGEEQVEPAGGRGSLGEVSLEAVAPGERSAEAEEPMLTQQDIGQAASSLAEDLSDLASRVQERKRHWDAIPAISPVEGEHWVSSFFGWRKSPFTGRREFHSGLDMAGHKGTPIIATGNGKVVRVTDDAALGRTVTVDHGNGIQTIFGHLDKTSVKRGQKVVRGDEIGKMGSSGWRSTGPHLHYALKVDGKYVNPQNYLLDSGRVPFAVAGQ